MTDTTWPRIKLSYSLEQDHKVLKQGTEVVVDMNYLEHINSYPADDPLRYEKHMLDDWFRARFGAVPPG
ncbi:MAG: DUF3016 domain-containing protein [Proteobacteria bacterium]|nr:DUF3016 domain-containing protein [Pseudomonadota bacterium]